MGRGGVLYGYVARCGDVLQISACAGTNEYDILTTIGEGGEKTIFNADFITAGNCYILRLEESQATPFRVRRLVLFPIGL